MRWFPFNITRTVALCCLISGVSQAGGQTEVLEKWRGSTGLTFTSGDYGTDTETTSTYLPFGIDRLFSRGRLGLLIPWVSITSEGDVSLVGGVPRKDRGKNSTAPGADAQTESGLGEIVFRGLWNALEETATRPSLSFTGKIKMPTGDEDRGLGTGEFDETVGVDSSKDVGDRWFVNGEFSYSFIGSPEDNPLRDSWLVAAGGGRYFPHHLTGSAELAWSRALQENDPDPVDMSFALQYTGLPRTSLGTSLGFGLTDGAPDFTFSLFGAMRF